MLFNLNKKQRPTARFIKVYAKFKTVDGEYHVSPTCKWFNSSEILCSVGQYFMYDIKGDGYIKDEKYIMYPLSNVVSIEWITKDERLVYYSNGSVTAPFSFSDEDFEKFEEVWQR